MSRQVFLNQEEHLGFSNIPNQIIKLQEPSVFKLDLLVVGGKHLRDLLVLNSLFGGDVLKDETRTTDKEHGVLVIKREAELQEADVLLKLRLSEVHFEDIYEKRQNSSDWLVSHIEERHYEYFLLESGAGRKKLEQNDSRFDLCLFLIQPHKRRLSKHELELLEAIHEKVLVVPIITQSEALTRNELLRLKRTIQSQLTEHKIQCLNFRDMKELPEQQQVEIEPFWAAFPLILPSGCLEKAKDTEREVKNYTWGRMEIEDPYVSDFLLLRRILFSHYHAVIQRKAKDIYERYRKNLLELSTEWKVPAGNTRQIVRSTEAEFERFCDTTKNISFGSLSAEELEQNREDTALI